MFPKSTIDRIVKIHHSQADTAALMDIRAICGMRGINFALAKPILGLING